MEILDFNEYKENNTPHLVHEAMCLWCFHRWIAVRPQGSLLKNLDCPCCGGKGGVINTGEEMGG